MGRLYLAANYVDGSSGEGQLQFVFDDRYDLFEAELDTEGSAALGAWVFTPFGRDHDDYGNTPYIEDRQSDPDLYGASWPATNWWLGADDTWALIGQIQVSLEEFGGSIIYDEAQNANAFVATVLNVLGRSLPQAVLDVLQPAGISSLPGLDVDLLQDGARLTGSPDTWSAIPLLLTGTGGYDFIQGGIGNDTLGGADRSDTIHGGGGDDFILGGEGYDHLFGEDGQDWIDGGAANDVVRGGSGDDTLFGGDGNDNVFGDGGDDLLSGGRGQDFLRGLDGDDWLDGGDYRDSLTGNQGNDTLFGGGGSDWLYGDWDDDQLWGGDGNDFLLGASGADHMSGGLGDDYMSGGTQSDRMWGMGGADTLWGGRGDDMMSGGLGHDILWGSDGEDTLYGWAGRDTLYGGWRADVLYGGLKEDVLDGDWGNDTLVGGQGSDLLTGGRGQDVFVFAQGDGLDRITDFGWGNDAIQLDHPWVQNFAGVMAGATQQGDDVLLNFGGGDRIILEGVALSVLDPNDFIFV